MKKRQKLLFALILVLGTLFSINAAIAGNEMKRQELELREVQEKLDVLNSNVKDNESQQYVINKEIKNLNKDIQNLEDEIEQLEGQIEYNNVAIEEATLDLQNAINVLEAKKELLNDRLRVMYKSGNIGYVEVLLGSEDFTDLMSRADMLKKIVVHDQDLIKEMVAQKEIVEEKKAFLEEKKVELETLHDEKNAKQDKLNVKMASLKKKKAELVKNLKALEAKVDESNEEAKEINGIIANLKLMDNYVGGKMSWPVPGNTRVSSPFGNRIHPILKTKKFHSGIDIPAKSGVSVKAAQDGRVIWADWLGGYGKAIMIDHGGGIVTLYGHNSSLTVGKGETIKRGDLIAKVGSTGFSTGPHVHFEVRKDGNFVDPLGEWVRPGITF